MPESEPLGEDALLGGRVRLLQPREGLRATMDPVLLAAFIPARPGEKVLEGGCGAGPAFLCLAARVPGLSVIAIERDERCLPALAEIAARWPGRLEIIHGDAMREDMPARLRGEPASIVANLPYNVGTPLLIKWLTGPWTPHALTLMFQKEVAERIVAALAPPLPIDGASPTITVDIGIAIAPDDGEESGLLLARAEELAAQRPEVSIEPEATVFTNIAPGSADVVRPWVEALRNVGFAVFAKPKIDDDSDVDSDMLAHIALREREGLAGVLVASADGQAFRHPLEDIARSGIPVSVLGFREHASWALASDSLDFVDLEDIPGVFR
jgi:hypothetical protein